MTSTYIDAAIRIAEGIQTAIQDLGLDGISSGQVQIRKFPWDEQTIFTGITISFLDERVGGGTNASDDIGFRYQVTLVSGTSGFRDQITRIQDWRHTIRRLFHHKRLTLEDRVCICTVKYSEVYLPKQFRQRHDATGLEITVWLEENRE